MLHDNDFIPGENSLIPDPCVNPQLNENDLFCITQFNIGLLQIKHVWEINRLT